MKFKQWLETAAPAGQPAPGPTPEEQAQQNQLITHQDWKDMGDQFHNNLVQGISLQDLSNQVQGFLNGKVNNPHKTDKTLEKMAGQGMGHVQDLLNQAPATQ